MHVVNKMKKTRQIFQLYQRALARKPYLVQAIQAGTLMGTGDMISQVLIENKPFRHVDYKRTIKFSAIGFFIGGPALRFWYGKLNHYLGSSGKSTAIKKVIIDQAIFAPTFLCLLLVAVGTLQGKDWNNIQKEVKRNYLDILKTNYYIWPWVQLVNFYYVPLQYQVLVVQSFALVWNTYLSWKTNNKTVTDTD